MNSLSPCHKKISQKIFDLLCRQKYYQAETLFINELEKLIVNLQSKKQILCFCRLFYHDFNENYLVWVKSMGGDIKKEINKLHQSSHDNFLLANCRDSAALDDLIYKLLNFPTSDSDNYYKELQYDLSCYKKLC
jgi:hypothetical protein